jgi:hypothetical protein
MKGFSNKSLILNFPRVMNVVCFLLGNSPASEFYMPTFKNTLSVPFSKMEQSVPKRLHIKFRYRGITQKKAYTFPNKVLQKIYQSLFSCFKSSVLIRRYLRELWQQTHLSQNDTDWFVCVFILQLITWQIQKLIKNNTRYTFISAVLLTLSLVSLYPVNISSKCQIVLCK